MKEKLILKMMDWERDCPHRIQHFLKVLAFSELIAKIEGLDRRSYEILSLAAICHDVGIKRSLEKYGSGAGHYQELEGPPIAREMLEDLEIEPGIVDRVLYLIGHHHSYEKIEGLDYQILVEADFLVNIHEGEMPEEKRSKVRKDIFRTDGGRKTFDLMYG